MAEKKTIQKLASYTTLAAAGLAVEPAVAGIITSGPGFTPVTISPGNLAGISFGGSVGSVFQFNEIIATVTSTFFGLSAVIQIGPSGSAQGMVGSNDPFRLPSGYLVSASRNWTGVGTSTTNDIAGFVGGWNGTSGVPVRGYLGVRFQSPNLSPGFHYGFFDVEYDNTPDNMSGSLTIYGWAYEDVTDASILTGSQAAVPEPSTEMLIGLGLLALGASGVRARRAKARAAAAASTSDAV